MERVPDLESIQSRLRADLTAAMRAKDRAATTTIRNLLAALDNAQAVPSEERAGALEAAVGLGAAEVARAELSPDQVAAVLQRELDEVRSSAAEYERLGQDGTQLRESEALILRYL